MTLTPRPNRARSTHLVRGLKMPFVVPPLGGFCAGPPKGGTTNGNRRASNEFPNTLLAYSTLQRFTAATLWLRVRRAAPLIAVVLLCGCGPPGPRALLKGERLIGEGRYDQAVKELQTAARLLPKNAQAWNHLGLAHHGGGQPTEAFRAYRQALALDPKLAAPRYNIGCLLLEQDNPAAAIDELTSFTLLEAKSLDGWLKLGTAQLRARRYDAAEKSFKEAHHLHPRHPEALNGLGIIQLQRRRAQEALTHFTIAAMENPRYAPALLNAAVVAHLHLNNRPLALQKYRQYLEIQPRPEKADEVQTIVKQIEADLAPPVTRVAPAPLSRAETPARQTAEAGTNLAEKARAQPQAARPTNTPPSKEARDTASAPKTLASKAAGPTPKTNVPTKAETPPTKPAATKNAEPAETKPKPLPAAEQPVGTDLAQAQPRTRETAPAVVARPIPRYKYLSPRPPASGKFETYYQFGLSAFAAGRLGEALGAYEQALALRPDAVNARYNFALALHAAKYPLDAANELVKLLRQEPQDVGAHLMLANLYAQELNQRAKGREHYLRVLDLNPTHPQSPRIRFWLSENP
jgi:tetratricopeptide (TPR) repeat protein